MDIDDYMKYNKPELLVLSKDEYEAYEIFEKHLVKQNKILEKYRDRENDEEKNNCYCDLMVIRRQSGKRKSKGRYFEACQKFGTYEQGSKCNFFRWCHTI